MSAQGNSRSDSSAGGRKPQTRVVSEKRREQNRRSQKAYRERQRKQLESLQELVDQRHVHNESSSAQELRPAARAAHTAATFVKNEENIRGLVADDEDIDSSIIDIGQAFEDIGDLVLPSQPNLPLFEITIRLGKKPQISRTTTDATISCLSSISPTPSFSSLAHQPPTSSDPTTFAPLPQTPPRPLSRFSLQRNHLRLQPENYFAATFSIAASLGITVESYVNDHPSPFYLATAIFGSGFLHSGTPLGTVPPASASPIDPSTLAALDWHFMHHPAALRPTLAQLTVPHPSYLDCIIFPAFRERAIFLSAAGQLDHWDLFVDLVSDGLVCWGSVRADGMENGVAWSERSWEARPWFLRKWRVLVGGEDEDIWQGSRWWWNVRGESHAVYEEGRSSDGGVFEGG